MWLLDLPQTARALTQQECAKLLCFRYYSGLNLSCLAQSEPLSLEASHLQVSEQVQRVRSRAAKSSSKSAHRPASGRRPGSTDSDSDAAESSSKQRKQKSWRLHKKKAGSREGRPSTNKIGRASCRERVSTVV